MLVPFKNKNKTKTTETTSLVHSWLWLRTGCVPLPSERADTAPR